MFLTFKGVEFPEGAMINIKPNTLPSSWYFDYLTSNNKIQLKKSKAMYDVNIAVLSVNGN